MKYIITERQYRLMEQKEEILKIPFGAFGDDWNLLQKFLERRGYPPYEIIGDLDLRGTPITSLGNLTSVGGYLDLNKTEITSLGNLTSVGGYLDLDKTKITSFGNLTSVGGDLDLYETPIASKYTKEEIRQMVNVEGSIFKL